MNVSSNICDVDESNAQHLLIDESFNRVVVVDFWAEWCGPCKQLMPVLEKIANEYDGSFLLAKINADEQQMLAEQLGVKSLPTVMLFKDGQPIDGFSGLQSESSIRQVLDKYLPSPLADALSEASRLLDAGEVGDALGIYRRLWEESDRKGDLTLIYSGALIRAKRLDEAESILKEIRLIDQDSEYEKLMAQIELGREAARSPELQALEESLGQEPHNHAVRIRLAIQLSQAGHYRESLDHLLEVLNKDSGYNDGEARKVYLDTIATIGKGDPLAAEYQRKLFSLMY